MPDTKTSRPHDHNQGNQNRSYTTEQKAAVDRVRKCRGTDYYAILDVEKTVTADGVKKAYRRLALVMHPDKNGAPGADEAFKLISKAFQVLSDPQQRESFDRFGGDPARGGGGSGGGGGGGGGGVDPFAGFRGGAGGFGGGPELSPEDLFNMFFGGTAGAFGGGLGGGGFGQGGFGTFGGGGPFGEFISFGAPGIRVQHFGGGPGMRRRRPAPAGAREEAEREEPQQEASMRTTFIQLLPLIILFVFTLLPSLFGELGSGNGKPQFPDVRFEEIHPFTQQRFTPRHHIPYWVSPRELKEFGMQPGSKGLERKLREMDMRAEVRYVSELQKECIREMEVQQKEVEEAMGWFWADGEKAREARAKRLPACERLRELGERRVLE